MKLSDLVTETDLQTAFDKVVVHLAKQGKPAEGTAGGCRYRAPRADGTVLSCAVGCLISDDNYQRYIYRVEGRGLFTVMNELGVVVSPEEEGMRKLLHRLQSAHDTSLTRKSLRANLVLAALDLALKEDAIVEHMPDSWLAGPWRA